MSAEPVTDRRTAAVDVLGDSAVAPSILSADYARLGDQVDDVLAAGARVIHFDVMDGKFVPAITFGPLVVRALSGRLRAAGAIADVHLMIDRPEQHIESFAAAGADVITIHSEATPNVHYALAAIKALGCRAGLAINPGTPAEHVAPVAETIDLALCMTVNPGWGGQRFIDSTRLKIPQLRRMLPPECAVEVDGGIDTTTAPMCAQLGANILVAGSAIFGSDSPADAYRELATAIAEL